MLNAHSRLVVSLWFGEDFATFGYDSTLWDETWANTTATGGAGLGAAGNPLVVPYGVKK
jgi:hypothetical protein